MNKRRTTNHIDTDCSQQSHIIVKDQSESYHRNNHNSGLIQHDDLIKSTTNEIGFRKRRTTLPYHHRSESFPSSTLLIIIRLIILFILILIVYYVFIYIYPKSKQNNWERIWYIIMNWLMGE